MRKFLTSQSTDETEPGGPLSPGIKGAAAPVRNLGGTAGQFTSIPPRLGRLICVTGWAVAGCGMSCLALTEPRLAVRSALAVEGRADGECRTGRLAKGNAGRSRSQNRPQPQTPSAEVWSANR